MAKPRVAQTPLICQRCGISCQRNSNSQRFCKPCKRQAQLEAHRSANAKYEASRPARKRNKPIDKARQDKWLEANRDMRLASVRAYNDRNRDEINRKARERRALPEVKEKRRGIDRKYRSQPKQRVDGRMKASIQSALKGRKAGRSWESLVGYSLDDLVRHLERQFANGMSWENMGQWEIDHIRPRSVFAYESAEDPEFRACWQLLNLRPLWAELNRSKHAKLTHLL